MTEIQRETGTTFLLSTHDRELAERCERRIYIEGGVVVDAPQRRVGMLAPQPAHDALGMTAPAASRVPLRVIAGDAPAVIDLTTGIADANKDGSDRQRA
jgi:ABC-type dipeptide/oligopeptide/nickel transport system ATPase component